MAASKNKVNCEMEGFVREGYILHSLDEKNCVFDVRSFFEKELKKRISKEATLEDCHQFVIDDDRQLKLQYELSQMLWKNKPHKEIFKMNLPFFKELACSNLDVQARPHFRRARPGKPQDNIGFHRDIEYGASPYAISCFFALTDLDEKSALQLVPQSHTFSNVKIASFDNKGVDKGSIRNKLGVPYKFQCPADDRFKSDLVPIPMKTGDVLCFNSAMIHGQEINKGDNTQWSIDSRIQNSFVKSDVAPDFYENLSQSPATKTGLIYYQNNPESFAWRRQ